MSIKQIIEHLENIVNTKQCTVEEEKAIKEAIVLLKSKLSMDQLISVAKILADLIAVGVKIFD